MNISTNIRQLTNVFILLFLALSGALVYWQVVVPQQVTANIHNSRTGLPDNAPVRGTIFDRNGVPLAVWQSLIQIGKVRLYVLIRTPR